MKLRNIPGTSLIKGFRAYQWARAGKQSPCRYWPSCSEYAIEAVEVHGAVRGGWLAARRVGRCHPWGGSGVDPVPEPRDRKTDLPRRALISSGGGA
ncbi:MAG: membrane protein insertion efficiency factor YidD [Acidimicrobiia bacterium]